MPAGPPGRWRQAAIGLVVGSLVGASLGLGSLGLGSGPAGRSPPLGEQVTGLEALQAVQSLLASRGGQQWTDFSDLGISSAVPFSPWLLGGNASIAGYFPDELTTLWSCHALPIPSIWNASAIPAQPGNLSSGRAPFWQFLFANESRPGVLTFAVGVVANASVYAVQDLPSSSPCITALGFGGWTQLPLRSQPVFDTSQVGPAAFADLASAYSPLVDGSAVLWLDGTPVISNLGWGATAAQYGPVWDADYYICGEAGEVDRPDTLTSAYVGLAITNGSVVTGPALGSDSSCTLSNYNLTTAVTAEDRLGDGFVANLSFAVSSYVFGATYNGTQGISTWMAGLGVTTAGGEAWNAGADACPLPVTNLSLCVPATGWAAVLLSPTGGWLDSYGLIGGTPGWSQANVPLISGETIAILSDTPLAGSGDVVSVVPNVGWPAIGAAGAPATL